MHPNAHTNPKLGALQRQSAVARILGESPPAEEAEGGAEDAANAAPEPPPLERRSYRILRGRREAPPSLELRNRRGQRRLFDWDGVTGANLDDPGMLVLHVLRGGEPYTVTLTGRLLDAELAEGVARKRVEWVEELDELAAADVARKDPTVPVVTGIRIAQGSESSEW